MIIHIVGPSGSGKTTLGNKLSKKYKNKIKIIETDDIDDNNRIKIIKNYKFEKTSEWTKFDKDTAKLNKNELKKLLEKYKNKIIIITGFFHPGMDFLIKQIDHLYMIEIDEITLWNQYNQRTFEHLNKNSKSIKKLLNNKKIHPLKKHLTLMYKYNIRNGFDSKSIMDLKTQINNSKRWIKNKKGFYGDHNKIIKDIHKKIKNNK